MTALPIEENIFGKMRGRFDEPAARRLQRTLDETFGHLMALPDELKRELAARIDDIFATRPTGWQLVEKK